LSNIKITSPDDFITMPWRNGLGSTIELLKHDLGGSFQWRLSMADVTQDGAFSDFSGYDRCLVLIDGAGITLTDNKGQKWSLTSQLDAAHFKGEDLIDARLHDGPIRDFNLMTSRQNCRAKVFTSQQQTNQTIRLDADLFLLFNIQGSASFKLDGNTHETLDEQHLMQLDSRSGSSCDCSGEVWIGILITYL
jgi:environmental stress-induced protein Ves|tara:strand:- start:3301 stop:3876 length:576 start_codon:yes stop_codon:yes gene_type:complete